MSGYYYKLIVEFKADPRKDQLSEIVEEFKECVIQLLEKKEVIVEECLINTFTDHYEIIFFDEYPIMSFYIFFEIRESGPCYINIIDLVKASSEMISGKEFFSNLMESLNKKVDLTQAVLLYDPVIDSYQQLFEDIKLNRGEWSIHASYPEMIVKNKFN